MAKTPTDDGDFSYRAAKDGKVLIAWKGCPVVTLKGGRAARFLARAQGAGADQLQLLMARCTGNFKRGNERQGKTRS